LPGLRRKNQDGLMTQDKKKSMIKMLLEAYKETGNRRFLLRALKLTQKKG
jgi:hypothetical protein